jgi:alcohol dehydrogenase class IV
MKSEDLLNTIPFCSSQIIFESKESLYERLIESDAENIALLIGESAVSRWNLQSFLDEMQRKHTLKHIKHCPANPTQSDIISGLRTLGDFKPDCFVAIGGGSVIDLAKALSAFWNKSKNNTYTIEEITDGIIRKTFPANAPYIDIIAVPTTAGTGAELTQWGTIWDAWKTGKFSVDAPGLKPKLALICPELTQTLPQRLTLSTSLDTLAHALEAFWSKNTNPIVKELAKQTASLCAEYLKPTLQDPMNMHYRERLCRASVLSALAFSQTKTTACHSISYPLTILFGIEHGFAAAMTLAEVYEINRPATTEMEDLDRIFAPHGGIRKWIDDAAEGVVRLRLKDFGVAPKDIKLIAKNAFTAGRMDNNPVDLDEGDVERLLWSVMG